MKRARNRKGQFTRRRKSNPRRTYRRRNYMSAGSHPMQNRRRRRRSHARRTYRRRNYYLASNPKRRRRRSYRRNPFGSRAPKLLGFQLPSLRDSIAAGAGFLLPPIVEGFVAPYLPAILTTNVAGRWAVRIGSVAATGAALGRFVGRREGSLALIGGGVWLISTAIHEFMPGMLPAGAPMSGQPLLGSYTSLYQVPADIGPTQTPMTYDAPDRLQPTSRF